MLATSSSGVQAGTSPRSSHSFFDATLTRTLRWIVRSNAMPSAASAPAVIRLMVLPRTPTTILSWALFRTKMVWVTSST